MIMLADGKKYMIDQLAPDIFAVSLSNESNISKLPAGFYLLSVNDGKGTKAAKFVKE